MKNFLPILLALSFFASSCKTNQVLVKFKNDSSEDFRQLYVGISGKEFTFDNLKARQTTHYIKVDYTFRYCLARAFTEKDTIMFIPIDYVGERLYTAGKLIMEIGIIQGKDSIRELDIKSKRPIF